MYRLIENSKIANIISYFSTALLLLAMLVAFLSPARALEITDTGVDITRNDFILEPAKIEVILDPGESSTKVLSITNRSSEERVYKIEIEDFAGSKDPKTAVQLLGREKSPYSLKDFIRPEVESVTLKPGQKANINVNIAIPQNAEPGGRYASVLVSTGSAGPSEQSSGAKSISRVGALYFIRVNGPVKEDAKLIDFKMVGGDKFLYEKGPFNFEILFENNGSVHLIPSGSLTIKNTFGQQVADIPMQSFFSLPQSLRGVQLTWDPGLAFGRYTANVQVTRGYQENPDQTDAMSLTFWVLPWKVVIGFVLAIAIVAFILKKIFGSFEIKRKE